MAKNQITGRVIAVSDIQTIASKDANKQGVTKRQLYMDCTRYDPYTGERGYENTPLLDFKRKGLEKLEALLAQGLKKGDIVTVSFGIQGNKWTNQDNKTQIITSIEPYDIEIVTPQGQQQSQQAQQPAQAPVQHPQGQPQGQQQASNANGLNDGNGEPLPF